MKLLQKFIWMITAGLLFLGCQQSIAHAGVLAKFGDDVFLTPVEHAPAQYHFEYKDAQDVSGEIAYAYGSDIVVRTLENGKQKSVISLPSPKGGILFDVQISPNGRYVLFKSGSYGNPFDTFRIFYWDLKTKQVFLGSTKRVTYYRLNWSPSSRYIAYCLGGDVNGYQHPFPNVNRPLRLYTYDTETHQTHFIAEGQGVIGWIWGSDDTLYYPQKRHDLTWVEGGENPPYDGQVELDNIYKNSPIGGNSSLVLEGAVPRAVSQDNSKILVGTFFTPGLPADERKVYPHQVIRYGNLCLYDIKDNKLKLIKGIDSYFRDVRFISDYKVLYAEYNYHDFTGVLMVKTLDLSTLKFETIAKVEEVDGEPYSNRAVFQPQFGFFRLSENAKQYFFSSLHSGKRTGVKDSHGAIQLTPNTLHLSVISTETKNHTILCETNWSRNFSWAPLFEGENNESKENIAK